MATFEEKAERLKKELEEAPNGDQRRNLSHEYELTLRLLRIIRGEVFTLDDINKCRQEIMRQHPGYERPITADSGILLAAEAIRKSFGRKYYLPLYKYPILIDFGTPDGQICVVHPSNFVCYTAPFLRRISAAFSYSVVPAVYKETTAGRESFRRWK
uniref:hypothetical protein n=1 Tax=Alistipes putredinis TaxID=28117 RepID=UPI003FD85556